MGAPQLMHPNFCPPELLDEDFLGKISKTKGTGDSNLTLLKPLEGMVQA